MSRIVLRVISVNIGLILFVLVAAELVFGNWLFGPNYSSLNIPRNTYRNFDVSGLYAGGGIAQYSRDDHGLRGAYGSPADIDIITIGGSTTNQLYIDNRKTWQAHMRDSFLEEGKNVTIVNAGLDGQSTIGNIAIFDQWFPKIPSLRSLYFLAYVGINDQHLEYQIEHDEMKSPQSSRRFRHWVMNKSIFYKWFRILRGHLLARNAKLIHDDWKMPQDHTWKKLRPANQPAHGLSDASGNFASYRQRIMRLVESIRGFGAEAILVTQPRADFRIRDDWIYALADRNGNLLSTDFEGLLILNRITLEVCKEVNATCIDLARNLVFKDEDFYDLVHNTPKGTKKIGDFLHQHLKHLFP